MKIHLLILSALCALVLLATGIASAADCNKAAQLSREAGRLATASPELAEKKFKKAIQLCTDNPTLLYNLAMVYYQQSRYDAALKVFEKALKIAPEYAPALNGAAYIMVLKETNAERALELSAKATSLEPRNRSYEDTFKKAQALLTVNVDNPPSTGLRRPNAVAVVIGNRDYEDSIVPTVKFAINDAAVVKQYLVKTMGFKENNIIFMENADFVDMKKAFGDSSDHKGMLYSRVRKNKSDVFIFYSGHGAPDTNTKKAYLMPVNADPDSIKFSGYSLDTLYANLAKLSKDKKPRSITVVIDACFSGGYNDGMLIKNASPIFVNLTVPTLRMGNAAVITSSKANQISSWLPGKRHGLFTYHFLKAIKDKVERGKAVNVGDIERALSGVNEQARSMYSREQQPQVMGKRSIGIVGR